MLIEFADLIRSDNMDKKEKNGWLRGLGLEPNLFGELKKTIQNILKSEGYLNADELLKSNGKLLDWHQEYLSEKEDWKDGDAPLLINDVHLVNGHQKSKQVFIHYTCSRKNCHNCHSGNPNLHGHHVIVETGKYSGMKYYGKVSKLVQKLKTFSVLHPVPVFKLYEENNGT